MKGRGKIIMLDARARTRYARRVLRIQLDVARSQLGEVDPTVAGAFLRDLVDGLARLSALAPAVVEELAREIVAGGVRP
jgi:hypothetical protein